MPIDPLKVAQAEAVEQSTLSQQESEELAQEEATMEARQADIYGAAYRTKAKQKLEARLTEIRKPKKIEEQAGWEANNVRLSTGEWVSREEYNKLGEEDKDRLVKLGVKGFNDYQKQQAEDFKDNYVKIGDNEYLKNEDYANLPRKWREAMEKGVRLGLPHFDTMGRDMRVRHKFTYKQLVVLHGGKLDTPEETRANELPIGEWSPEEISSLIQLFDRSDPYDRKIIAQLRDMVSRATEGKPLSEGRVGTAPTGRWPEGISKFITGRLTAVEKEVAARKEAMGREGFIKGIPVGEFIPFQQPKLIPEIPPSQDIANYVKLPNNEYIDRNTFEALPQMQREILQTKGSIALRSSIGQWEKILGPYTVQTEQGKQYKLVDAIREGNKDISVRDAVSGLFPEKQVSEIKYQSGLLQPPSGLASDAEFSGFDVWEYRKYSESHPEDPRVKWGHAQYGAAKLIEDSKDKTFLERLKVEGQVLQNEFANSIAKIGDYVSSIKVPESIATGLRAATYAPVKAGVTAITLFNPGISKTEAEDKFIHVIESTKEKVANFLTEEQFDKWIQDKKLSPITEAPLQAGKFIFDTVKTLGASLPLTVLSSDVSINKQDYEKAAKEIAETIGGLVMFPAFFVGSTGKSLAEGQTAKVVGTALGLGLTMVIGPKGFVQLARREIGKVTGFPKMLSPGTGSITLNIPMSSLGRGLTPSEINTMQVLQSYLKDGIYTRDRIVLDSTGKLTARVTPLARSGITDHFHVTNRFDEYTKAVKSVGKVSDLSTIASRGSPFPGKGAYFSPNISLETGMAIEPIGGKSGVIAHTFEFKQVPSEIQKIYTELSKLDPKRTPFDIFDGTVNRAVDKYIELESKGQLEPGTYPVFKMWWRVDYGKLLDVLKQKRVGGISSWQVDKLNEKQIAKLTELFEELDTDTQAKAKEWWLENESYRTANAPLYPTKATLDTTISELGNTCGGSYVRTPKDLFDPDGRKVFKEGQKVPVMWLSEKPNQAPPSLKQRVTAEYIYEPLTTLRKLLKFRPRDVRIGYGGGYAGELRGLEIAKRPNVNDYLNMDRRATAIIRNPRNNSQILVGRQFNPDLRRLEDHFDTIGGSPFRLGESVIETVVRETLDEAGLYAVGGNYLGTIKGRHMNTRKGRKYVEEERVFDVYETKFKGTPKPSGEIRELAWYDGVNLYELSGKPIRGRVSNITPKLYQLSNRASKNVKWEVVEPKRNIEREKPLTYKKEQGRYIVKEKGEEAIVIIEDASGNLLSVDNIIPSVVRSKGQTTKEAIARSLQDKGLSPNLYSYVQTWLDFPSGEYSSVFPGKLTDLYIVKVQSGNNRTKVIGQQELNVLSPRYADAYINRRDTLNFQGMFPKVTDKTTYISAELPLETKVEIAGIQAELRNEARMQGWDFIEWQNPDTFHITLKFTGRVPIGAADKLLGTVGKISDRLKINPVRFKLKEWEGWPNFKDVDVVSLRLKGLGAMDELTKLQREIDAAATEAGLPADTYRFEPHVTLLSIKDGTPINKKMELGGYLLKNQPKKAIDAMISSVLIKESRGGKLKKSVEDEAEFIDMSKPKSEVAEIMAKEVREYRGKRLEERRIELYPGVYKVGDSIKESIYYGEQPPEVRYASPQEYKQIMDYKEPSYVYKTMMQYREAVPKYTNVIYGLTPSPSYPVSIPKYSITPPMYTPGISTTTPRYPSTTYRYAPVRPVTVPTIPTKTTTIIIRGGQEAFEELTLAQKLASIAWKQGWCYHLVYPPYGSSNVIHSRKPFPGVRVFKGVKSAYKSLARLKGKVLPEKIYWNLGIQDITFERGKGKVVMRYREHTEGEPKVRRSEGWPEPIRIRRQAVVPLVGSIK